MDNSNEVANGTHDDKTEADSLAELNEFSLVCWKLMSYDAQCSAGDDKSGTYVFGICS